MKIRKLLMQIIIVCFMGFLGCGISGIDVVCNFENSSMEQSEQESYTEKVMNFIDMLNKYGKDNNIDKLTIYVDDLTPTMYQSNEMYINTSEVFEFQTFFELMLAVNEEVCNAGEAYGLAAQLYEENGLGVIEQIYSNEELAAYFSDIERMYLLDFTLPMLEPYFFDEETAEYVQSASVAFADYCVEEYGMSKAYRLCMDGSEDGHAKLVELKNDWLAEIGVTETYEECGKLAFAYNYEREAEDYPYVIREESANWSFSSTDVKNVGYCTFVKEYEIVAPVSELDFAEAREVLKAYVPEEISKVDILTQFYNTDTWGTGANYNRQENAIWAYGDWRQLKYSLLHEYVHYLTMGDGKVLSINAGLVEGITEEISVFECENHLQKMYYQEIMADEEYGEQNYAFAKEIGALNPDTNQLEPEVYYYYRAKIFCELEPSASEYKSILSGMTPKPSNMTLSALSYPEAGSLARYLVEQYGMDETLKNCTDVLKLQELTGKSFLELYEDWGAWNEQKYQELKAK